jgi:hypothetical protein
MSTVILTPVVFSALRGLERFLSRGGWGIRTAR